MPAKLTRDMMKIGKQGKSGRDTKLDNMQAHFSSGTEQQAHVCAPVRF